MRLAQWLLDLFYPPKCVFCRKLLKENETGLCARCRVTLPYAEISSKRGEFFECCWVCAYYEDQVAEAIKRYKFNGMEHYAPVFGSIISMHLLSARVEFDVLTWVPISKKRLKKRGYDQSCLLAKAIASELNVECERTIKKIRDNAVQSKQRDVFARKANVMNVYEAVNPDIFREKRVLLIDDVMTTGATLSECSRILLTAGAANVQCAVLAATRKKEKKTAEIEQ